MSVWLKALIAALLLGAAGGGGYFWWLQQKQPFKPVPVASAPSPAPVPAPSAPAAAAEPAVRHPIDAVVPGASDGKGLPELAQSDGTVGAAMVDLLGRKEALSFLQLDRFVRNAVATVDNLGRQQTSARLWPVVPTRGRMVAVNDSEGLLLSDGNAERYMPFVRFVGAVDTGRAASLYVRLYPLFQSAYEELGYPRKHFNDRLVDVIDLLLKTPEPATPIRLKVTEVKGPLAEQRPANTRVIYEFADPALESCPSGQKILMRMGAANQKLLKDKLREFRERIVLP